MQVDVTGIRLASRTKLSCAGTPDVSSKAPFACTELAQPWPGAPLLPHGQGPTEPSPEQVGIDCTRKPLTSVTPSCTSSSWLRKIPTSRVVSGSFQSPVQKTSPDALSAIGPLPKPVNVNPPVPGRLVPSCATITELFLQISSSSVVAPSRLPRKAYSPESFRLTARSRRNSQLRPEPGSGSPSRTSSVPSSIRKPSFVALFMSAT